jgi:hypothetical protein
MLFGSPLTFHRHLGELRPSGMQRPAAQGPAARFDVASACSSTTPPLSSSKTQPNVLVGFARYRCAIPEHTIRQRTRIPRSSGVDGSGMSPSCPPPTDVSGRRAVNVVPRSGVLSTSIALRALRKSTGRLPGPIWRHHCQVGARVAAGLRAAPLPIELLNRRARARDRAG